jgi:hypothetical protein
MFSTTVSSDLIRVADNIIGYSASYEVKEDPSQGGLCWQMCPICQQIINRADQQNALHRLYRRVWNVV